jgi:hypothetical protein
LAEIHVHPGLSANPHGVLPLALSRQNWYQEGAAAQTA